MAISEKQHSIAFIQCAFAIECLLQYQEDFITKGITAEMSESVAFIVGYDEESRKNIAGTFSRLYRIRSKIAHGKQADSIDADLQEIIWLSKQIVINLLLKPELKKIATIKSFNTWITDKRYEMK
jgi:hypothetical protein